MKKIILPVVLISLFISSCCTKKYCEPEQLPSIKVTLEGFNPSTVGFVIVYEANSGLQMDSFDFYQNTVFISKHEQGYYSTNKIFNIHSESNRIDTLHQVTYDLVSERIECNSCFMSKDYQEISRFQNLHYHLNTDSILTESVSLHP